MNSKQKKELHIVVVALVGDMLGCKSKVTLLCVVSMLIVFHCFEAARYEEDSENRDNVHDVRTPDLIEDELESWDSQPTRVKIIAIRPPRRRIFPIIVYDRRRRAGRRRKSWRW